MCPFFAIIFTKMVAMYPVNLNIWIKSIQLLVNYPMAVAVDFLSCIFYKAFQPVSVDNRYHGMLA